MAVFGNNNISRFFIISPIRRDLCDESINLGI